MFWFWLWTLRSICQADRRWWELWLSAANIYCASENWTNTQEVGYWPYMTFLPVCFSGRATRLWRGSWPLKSQGWGNLSQLWASITHTAALAKKVLEPGLVSKGVFVEESCMSLFLRARPPPPQVYPLWGPRLGSTPTRGRSLFKCKSRLRDVGLSGMETGCFWSLHFLLTNWEWSCFPDKVRVSDRNLETVNESLKFCQYQEEVVSPHHRPIKSKKPGLKRHNLFFCATCSWLSFHHLHSFGTYRQLWSNHFPSYSKMSCRCFLPWRDRKDWYREIGSGKQPNPFPGWQMWVEYVLCLY